MCHTVISFAGVSPVILRPGLLPNHYAPETPLSVHSEIPCCFERSTDVGILLFEASERTLSGVVEVLGVHGNGPDE